MWPATLTLSERVALGEDFFEGAYELALAFSIVLVAIAVALALADGQRGGPLATIAVATAYGAAFLWMRKRYTMLRRYRHALILGGIVCALVSLWPPVDANAVYFPALAPLALIACVAQRMYERILVIASLAAGTYVAALLDTRSSYLARPSQLLSATVAVVILGGLLNVITDWWARRVLLAGDDAEPPIRGRGAFAGPGSAIFNWLTRRIVRLPGYPPVERFGEDLAVAPPPAEVVAADRRPLPDWVSIEQLRCTPRHVFAQLRPERIGMITAREIEILFYIGAGLDHADIADCLGIKTATVDRHVLHIRRKAAEEGLGEGPTRLLALELPELSSDRQIP